MKRVIDGKRYDTETANKLFEYQGGDGRGDLDWHCTALYRTKRGVFFIAGQGNARSLWAQRYDSGASGPGFGIRVLSDDSARSLLERFNQIDLLEEFFGDQIEDG